MPVHSGCDQAPAARARTASAVVRGVTAGSSAVAGGSVLGQHQPPVLVGDPPGPGAHLLVAPLRDAAVRNRCGQCPSSRLARCASAAPCTPARSSSAAPVTPVRTSRLSMLARRAPSMSVSSRSPTTMPPGFGVTGGQGEERRLRLAAPPRRAADRRARPDGRDQAAVARQRSARRGQRDVGVGGHPAGTGPDGHGRVGQLGPAHIRAVAGTTAVGRSSGSATPAADRRPRSPPAGPAPRSRVQVCRPAGRPRASRPPPGPQARTSCGRAGTPIETSRSATSAARREALFVTKTGVPPSQWPGPPPAPRPTGSVPT